MPPARREKGRADPVEGFSLSQSSNDLDYDLKVMMAQQYCAKLRKKKSKETKTTIQEAVTNGIGEISESSLELVESIQTIRQAWRSTVLKYIALDDKITRDIAALENHKLDMLRYVSGFREEVKMDEILEQQIQGLEKIHSVCEVVQQVWNTVAADQIEEDLP